MRWKGTTPRLIVAVVVGALLSAACSSMVDDDTAPTTSPIASTTPSSTTTSAPQTTDAATDDLENQPPSLPEPASADAIASVAGVLAIRNAEGDLIVTNPDGSGAVTMANGHERRLSQPTWSNGGALLAWSALDTDGAAIEIAAIASEFAVTAETATPPFYLSWSSDDSWIGALRPLGGGIEFLFASTSDGDVRPIGAGQPFYFDWRNDESVIAAVNGTTLVEVPASVEPPPTELAIERPLGVFQTPSLLSDEPRRFIAALENSGFNEVVVFDGGNVGTRLGRANGPVSIAVNSTVDHVAVNVFTGEPQSQVITFQTETPPDLESGRVSIIDLVSGRLTTRPEARIVATQWSPDGARLALLQAGDPGEPGRPGTFRWLVIDGDAVTALTPFSPSPEVAASYLPFADQYNHSTSWWSPDGRALVMSGDVGEETGIWVDLVDDDRGARRVADGDVAVWSPK